MPNTPSVSTCPVALATPGYKTLFSFAGPIIKLACILFSVSCIAVLGIYCPTTQRLLQSCTDSTQQIKTLASFQAVEGSAEEERATVRHQDLIASNGWRFYVNIRFGVALNFTEGANMARAAVHTTVVVLLALAAGCTGFVTVSLFLVTDKYFDFQSMNRALRYFR